MTDEAFSRAARTYGDTLFRVAYHALQNRADAEDVMQTVLLRLYESRKEVESETHLKHWLLRVAVNESRKVLRSFWRRRAVSLDEQRDEAAPEDSAQREVFEAVMALEPGDAGEIRARMDDLAARRREKQPLEYPSAGSTFKRPAGYFAGKLIQDSGLRGVSRGGAQVSEKHCGFVINRGGATAADVLELCSHVQATVKENFGVDLEMEVRRWGEF